MSLSDEDKSISDNSRVGLGAEWIGLIGVIVGSLLGIGGTLTTQRGERSARQEQYERDDYLRDRAIRADVYKRAAEVSWDLLKAAKDYCDSPLVDTTADIAPESDDSMVARLAVGHLAQSFHGLAREVELYSPAEVLDAITAILDEASVIIAATGNPRNVCEKLSENRATMISQMRADIGSVTNVRRLK